MVWWLGFWAFTSMAQVQSMAEEMRSHKSHGMGKKEQQQKESTTELNRWYT